MRAISIVLALLFCAGVAQAEELMSPRAFRDAGIARIRQFSPNAEVEIRTDLGIDVRVPGKEGEQIVNFHNTYALYRSDPAQLDELIDRLIRSMFQGPDASTERASLVTVLRHRDTAGEFARLEREEGGGWQIVWRPFAGDLIEILAFDGAETIRYAREEDLREMGVSLELGWTLARQNLPARMGELTSVPVKSGLELITGGNGLAPSRLVEANFCSSPGAAAKVFLVTDRESYLQADPNAPHAIEEFRNFVNWLRSRGQLASTGPLVCRNGALTNAPPPER